MSNQNLQALSDEDLLEQFADMTRWWHYDPMGAQRPSVFEVDALQAEILTRMRKSSGEDNE